MLEAGIITYTSSPWSAKSRFVIKKNGDLRPVHQFCALNDATIKSNYPMRRVEPILNNLMQPRFKLYWWADASNGFFAVPMSPPHAYKTGFSRFLGQFFYLWMAQGLCGAPHTFVQLKDYMGGPIPSPNAEPAVFDITESESGASAYESFFDDDSGSNELLETQACFLHERYFPRIKWAYLVGNVIWPSLLNYVLFRWKLFVDWFRIGFGFVLGLFLLCVYSVCLYLDDEKADEEERGGSIAGSSGF